MKSIFHGKAAKFQSLNELLRLLPKLVKKFLQRQPKLLLLKQMFKQIPKRNPTKIPRKILKRRNNHVCYVECFRNDVDCPNAWSKYYATRKLIQLLGKHGSVGGW